MSSPEHTQRMRSHFTEQLIANYLPNHPQIANAFRAVDRAHFIPRQYQHRNNLAYEDKVIPLQEGSTISQPSLVARMLTYLNVKEGQNVLEVGSASGYQAALLGELVGPRGSVHTIEINHELVEHASAALQTYPNVTVHEADGTHGIPAHAPYDRIIVTAAGTEVPVALRDQLAVGGLLLMPVGPQNKPQKLILLRKVADDDWDAETLSGDVLFVPFRGFTPKGQDAEQSLVVRDSPPKKLSDTARDKLISLLIRGKKRRD